MISLENSVIRALLESQNSLEKVVLTTIIRTYGSTPRSTGTRMLVGKNGRIAGTIGGGIVEKAVCKRALQLVQTRENNEVITEIQYGLSTCGGSLDVMMEAFPKKDFWQCVEDCQMSGICC